MNNVGSDGITQCTIYLVSAIALIIIWFYSNRFPKTKKGKVGFVVSIQCSNDEEYRKIKEDFVSTLRNLLKAGNIGKSFHFIDIPQHLSCKINDEHEAFDLVEKTRAHFIIYGRVRLRNLNNKECHIIELEGIVGHKPIPEVINKRLSTEFAELFPRKVNITTDNELLSFNFTSDWTECVAKYIIGIAAGCSHDLHYARLLFQDVMQRLEYLDANFPVFKKMRKRLPVRLAEVNLAFAISYLERWRENQDIPTYQMFAESIKNIPDGQPIIYEVLLLKGIEAFLTNRDIDKAIEYTKKCKKFNDPVWKFNLAFLLAYSGQLSESISYYRKGMKYNLEAKTISQVEDFIVWALKIEPTKYQLFYCLGFFNRHIKGDLETALIDFEKFTKNTSDPPFQKEKNLAINWILELKRQIALN